MADSELVSSPLSDAEDEVNAFVARKMAPKLLKEYVPISVDDQTVGILQAFLKYAPQPGLNNVLEDIMACQPDNSKLRELADHYRSSILIPGMYRQQEKLRNQLLIRDNSRCVLTQLVDDHSVPNDSDLETHPLQAAHILPFSLGCFTENERYDAARIWEALRRVFPSLMTLTPENINDPSNALMMCDTLHTVFGQFRFCLEPLEADDSSYKIVKLRKFPNLYSPRLPPDGIVRFVNHSNPFSNYIPLPNKKYLEAHAAVAKILHATGLAESLDKALREGEALTCFAEDGTSDVYPLLMARCAALRVQCDEYPQT
ncbi:hypothetical protein K440DRAFT_646148 [Wilcoxina mikolae CBS 423.85]|nr:hypothetical protein K440DRAFT_646148 [Wilcoxina mikolae CBS 423.85]